MLILLLSPNLSVNLSLELSGVHPFHLPVMKVEVQNNDIHENIAEHLKVYVTISAQ